MRPDEVRKTVVEGEGMTGGWVRDFGAASLACAGQVPDYSQPRMTSPRVFFAVLFSIAMSCFAQDDENVLTPQEKAEGWKLLFDGKATPGLVGLQKREFLKEGWGIQDGTLLLPKTVRQSGKATGGDLVTAEQFTDFEFKFDFKLTASALSGVLYFARGGMGQKPTGHEYQIIDDVHHPDGLKGGPLCRTGALYGVLPPSENKRLHPSDEWNSGMILVRGNHVEHWLNGDKILEYECGSQALSQAVRANKAKVSATFGSKIKSSLAILDKGEEVAFRNLKIRAISATPPPPPPPLGAPTTNVIEPAPAMVVPAKAAWKLPPPPPPPILKP